jgi:hypothetical protein
VHPDSLRSQLSRAKLDPITGRVVYEPLIESFLKQLKWHDTLTSLWLMRAVYVIGNPKVKGHIMEVRGSTHVSDSVALAAPLSSRVVVTVYDENVVDGKQTWLVDYDMVLRLSSIHILKDATGLGYRLLIFLGSIPRVHRRRKPLV